MRSGMATLAPMVLRASGLLIGAVVGVPEADGGIGRAVGFGQFVVGFGLLHGKYGSVQVRTSVECLFAIIVEREQAFGEIEGSVDVDSSRLDGGH